MVGGRDGQRSTLLAPGEHKKAAIFLPMVTKGEAEVRRWRLSIVDGGKIGLMIFAEHLRMRHVAAIAIDRPVFWKGF
jgi:hypothetical protein